MKPVLRLINRREVSEINIPVEDIVLFGHVVGRVEYYLTEDPYFMVFVEDKSFKSRHPNPHEFIFFQLAQVEIKVDPWGEIHWCDHKVGEITQRSPGIFSSKWLYNDERLYPHTSTFGGRTRYPEVFKSKLDAAFVAVKQYIAHNFPEVSDE